MAAQNDNGSNELVDLKESTFRYYYNNNNNNSNDFY